MNINSLSIKGFTLKRESLLLGALLLYGFFGDPMPNEIGIALLMVGVAIIIYTGFSRGISLVVGASIFQKERPLFISLAMFSFLYLMLAPLIVAVFYGYNQADILRDIIPHFFLFIPVFFYDRISVVEPKWRHILAVFLCVVGVCMSVRFIQIAAPSIGAIGSGHFGDDGKLVLAAEPSILFAAIYLPIVVLEKSQTNITIKLLSICFAAIGAVICLAAFGAKLSRGPFALTFLAYGIYGLWAMKGKIRGLMAIAFIVGAGSVYFYEELSGIVQLLIAKNERVGADAKVEEFYAVILAAGASYSAAFWGYGWGALIDNPFRGTNFSFTHSIFSYYMAKSGLIGLVFLGVYLAGFVKPILKFWKSEKAIFLAVSFSISYPFLFQPTFKVLTVGIILSLCFVGTALNKPGKFTTGIIDDFGVSSN